MISEVSFCEGLESCDETHPLGCQEVFNGRISTIKEEYGKIMKFSIEDRASILFALFEKVLLARKAELNALPEEVYTNNFGGSKKVDVYDKERIGEYAYCFLQEMSYRISLDYSKIVDSVDGAEKGLIFVQAFMIDGLDALKKKFGEEIFWIQFLYALDLFQAGRRPDMTCVDFYTSHFETRGDGLIATHEKNLGKIDL